MPPQGPELPSRRVEDDLRRRFSAGEWEAGERVPPVAELAQHYGVARNTVSKALRRLVVDGVVEIVLNRNVPGAELGNCGRSASWPGSIRRQLGRLTRPFRLPYEQWPPS